MATSDDIYSAEATEDGELFQPDTSGLGRLNAVYNNPGALGLSDLGRVYGATASGKFDTGHPFAAFPTPEAGAAAQFALWQNKEHYLGHTLKDAITNWIGPGEHGEAEYISAKTGIPLDRVITEDLLRSPQGIRLMQAQAHYEGANVLTPEQWRRAQGWAYGGRVVSASYQPNQETPPDTDYPLDQRNVVSRIRSQYPDNYSDVKDEELYAQFTKKYQAPIDQFRKLYPGYDDTPDDQLIAKIGELYFPDKELGEVTEILKPPTGVVGAWKNFVTPILPNLVKSFKESIGNVAEFPQRAANLDDWIQKNLGAVGQFLEQDNNLDEDWRSRINRLYQWGKREKERASKVQLPAAKGIAGHVGAELGQAVGMAPQALMSFVPGLSPAQSLVWGMVFDGVSSQANAQEQKSDNDLAQGWLGAGTRAVQQWILNSPRGRLMTGLLNAAAGLSNDEAQKFLDGHRDNDIDRTIAGGAVNFVIGALMGHGRERLPASAQEQIVKASEAKEQGNLTLALDHTDAAVALLPDKDKAEVGQLLLKWRDDVIPTGGGAILQRDAPLPAAPKGSYNVRELEEQNKSYKSQWEPTQSQKDAMTDHYYAGFSAAPKMIGKIIEEGLPNLREFAATKTPEKVKAAGRGLQEFFDPESLSPVHETAGAIIAEQNARMKIDEQRMLPDWWRKQNLMDDLRFGRTTEGRLAFWNQFNSATMKKMLEAWEDKKSTGHPIADRFLKYYDAAYGAISRMDQKHGLNYNLRESYIPHILKRPEDIVGVQQLIMAKRWGDPSFMKSREFDNLRVLHMFGFELKTYNPEELIQLRLESSLKARAKVQALTKMAAAKAAISAKDAKSLPENERTQYLDQSNIVRSPGGGDYLVHKDADFMMHRAWDPNPLYQNPASALAVGVLAGVKQRTVGLRLADSGYHHLHMQFISMGNTMATSAQKFLASPGTGADFMRALGEATKGTVETNKMLLGGPNPYKRLVDFYQGKASFDELSESQKSQYKYQMMGGLAPVLSHERELQFHTVLQKVLKGEAGKVADRSMELGYKILTAAPYQAWLFKEIIPSLKMYAYDEAANALLASKPDLLKPENESQLRVGLREIAKHIDTRFGEVFYDNVFLPKWMKTVGQTTLLSMGWQMGAIDTFGGGLTDLTGSVLHADEVMKTMREEGAKPAAQRVFTNRVLYMTAYTALATISSYLVSAVVRSIAGGGASTPLDAIYPWIGKKVNGEDKRLKPPFFTIELANLQESASQKNPAIATWTLFHNKLAPQFATITQLMENKDYRGNEIVRKYDAFPKKIVDWGGFIIANSLPIPIENALRPGPNQSGWDVLMGFLGLPPAPSWTGRTRIDNEIIERYTETAAKAGKGKMAQMRSDASASYRSALQSGDQEKIREARDHMLSVGMTDRAINHVEQTLHQTPGQSLLKALDSEDQVDILKGMTPDEQRKYLPFASHKARELLGK